MEFVKGITSDSDLIELAKHIGVKINGIYEIQEVKKALPSKGSFVLLLRQGPGVGHWTAYNDGSWFDPTGVPPPTILGDLPYFGKQVQGSSDEYCGIWCLLWLYCRQHKKVHLMDRFQDLDIDVI